MPCPDVAAAMRHAAPQRRCRDAACRAPTSLPRRGMPRPDVAADGGRVDGVLARADRYGGVRCQGRGTACRAPTSLPRCAMPCRTRCPRPAECRPKLWSLSNYFAIAHAGGLRLAWPRASARRREAHTGLNAQSPSAPRQWRIPVYISVAAWGRDVRCGRLESAQLCPIGSASVRTALNDSIGRIAVCGRDARAPGMRARRWRTHTEARGLSLRCGDWLLRFCGSWRGRRRKRCDLVEGDNFVPR